jgi:hypothetical protein
VRPGCGLTNAIGQTAHIVQQQVGIQIHRLIPQGCHLAVPGLLGWRVAAGAPDIGEETPTGFGRAIQG